MALAEQLESLKDSPQPLGRDDFVKRRQAAREAAESGTPEPEGGDEASPLSEALEGADEQEAEVVEQEPEGSEAATEDPFAGIFDDDELGVESEPSKLTGLEPPATLNADEKELFEGAPDELKAIISRVSKAAAQKVQETGESLATRNKEIETRVAELDRALIEAKAVLDVDVDIPFTPIHSDEKLNQILESDGSEAFLRAQRENEKARADHQAALVEMKADRDKQKAEFDAKLAERRKEILTKFREDIPKLIPAWAKPEVAKKESGELSTYLTQSEGFSEAELKQVADARLIRIARKAMKYDRALAAARDRRSGKTVKSTAKPAPAGGRSTKPSNNAALEAALKSHRQKPTADTFARVRKLQREAAAAQTRRRV